MLGKDTDIQENIKGEINKLAKGAIVSTFGNVSGRLLNVISQILIARKLSPDFLGMYAIGWVLMRLLSPFADFGVRRMIIVYGPRFWKKDDSRMLRIIKVSFLLGTLCSALLAMLLILFSNVLANQVFNNDQIGLIIKAFAVILFFQTVMWVGESLTLVTLDIRYQVWTSDIIQPVLNLGMIFVFLKMGFGIKGVLNATIISFIAAAIAALFFVIVLFPKELRAERVQEPSIKELVNSSMNGILPNLFLGILPWLNRLLLGIVRPVWDIGIYQAVSQFSLLFTLIIMGFNSVLGPIIAKFNFSGDKTRELNEIYVLTTKWIVYLALPISVVTLFTPKLVIVLLFGNDYSSGAAALQILTLGQMINLCTGATGTILVNSKHISSLSKTAFVGMLLTIILTPLLSKGQGVTGAATAMAISYTIISLVSVIQVKRNVGIWPYDKRFWKGGVSAIICIFMCFLMQLFVRNLPPLWQLVGISAGVLLGFISTLLRLGLDAEDLIVIRTIKEQLKITIGQF